MSHSKLLICPYCGETQRQRETCRACGGHFDALSRQATQNEMGPWFVRAEGRAFTPGCSYEAMVRQIERGQLTKVSVVRGPTTRQLWTIARRVPGLAHLLGYCHDCDGKVDPESHHCRHCGVAFGAYLDRDWLGLPDVRPLPGEAPDGDPGASGSGWASQGLVPQARGLSSFAPNTELFEADSATAVATPTVDAKRGSSTASVSDEAAPAEISVGMLLESPAGRAMQQRTRRLTTTNRVLVVALVVVGLAGVLVNLAQLSKAPTVLPAAPEMADEAGDATDAGDPGVLAIPELEIDEETPAPASAEAPSSDARSADAPSSDPAEVEPVITPLDRLRAAVASAEGTGADAARLTRFRQALDMAIAIEKDALESDDDRAAYDDLRATIEREIERLELRESFFGG